MVLWGVGSFRNESLFHTTLQLPPDQAVILLPGINLLLFIIYIYTVWPFGGKCEKFGYSSSFAFF